jgi:uncharacterized delta-60 repeat protein
LVVAGYTYDGQNYEFAVARYSSTGAVDTSFGGTGTVHFNMGVYDSLALGVAVDSTNRVVVAGYASNGSNRDFAVARLTAVGVLDSSFGTGGKRLIDFGNSSDQAATVAIDSLDRVILAGYKNSDFAVARLTTAGVLDSGFGSGGKLTIDFGGSTDVAYGVTVDALGRVVVSGSARIGTNNDFAVARLTSAGALDSGFGTGGKVTIDFAGADDVAAGVATDSQGRVILGGWAKVGSNNVFAAARLNSAGVLDSGFGAGGKFTFAFGAANNQAWSVAVDSLDRVVLGGYASNGSDDDFAVARLTTAGALDAGFDGDGKQTIAFSSSTDEAYGVAIDSLDRIVVSGYTNHPDTDFGVARLTSAGALDTSFDGDGKQTTDFVAYSFGNGGTVAVDHLGRTIVAGYATTGSAAYDDFVIVRYTPAGALDTSFGGTGIVTIDMGGGANVETANGVAVDSMNRVIVAGEANYDFAVARLTASGALDSSFGNGGKVNFDFAGSDDGASSVTVDSMDRPVVAGFTGMGSGPNYDDFAVARLTTAGALDPSFGVGGKQSIDFGGYNDDASGVAIDSLGRVVLAGTAYIGGYYQFAAARLTPTGAPDAGFGAGGKTTFFMGSDADGVGGVAIDSQNRVVVAGSAQNPSDFNFAIARLTTAGGLDSSFNGNGTQYVSFGNTDDRASAVAVDSLDRVVVAGSSINLSSNFGVARLTADGALDNSFGTGGTSTIAFSQNSQVPHGVAIDSAGRAVVAGWTSAGGDAIVLARITGDPATASVQVNDGSAQRSEVRSITVTFSGPVTFAGGNTNAAAAAAFRLTHVQTGGNVDLTATVATDARGRTVVTLAFSGAETDPVSAQHGGIPSLADGRYVLTIFDTSVTGADGGALDGDGDGTAGGNYVSPADTYQGTGLHLYRLFGDANGDGVVDPVDLNYFRNTFNVNNSQAAFLAFLDANNDGVVDPTDLNVFRTRFNTNIYG